MCADLCGGVGVFWLELESSKGMGGSCRREGGEVVGQGKGLCMALLCGDIMALLVGVTFGFLLSVFFV